jgi:probable HAF family extracellular repeat protein
VNNSFIGLAVGQDDFTNSSGQTVIHAAFYNGDTYDTGTLGDNTDPNVTSVSYGIADYGNSTGIGAVGSSSVSNGDTHAFVQEPDGSLLDVGTLTGTKGNSAALGVNPAGTDVVGYAPFSDTSAAPFVYSPATGKMTEIKVPSSTAIQTQANAVNNSGVVVGSYGTAYLSGGLHLAETAFIRLAKGTVQNLNNEIAPGTGWDLESATGINSSGQICGYGTIDGQTHAFLLTPVTAPAKP